MNFFTPTKKPVGWGADRAGRRKRLYDQPRAPFDRLLAAGVLSAAQQAELTAYRDGLNPVDLARRIADDQAVLIKLAAVLIKLARDKSDRLRAATTALLPDTARGFRLQPAG